MNFQNQQQNTLNYETEAAYIGNFIPESIFDHQTNFNISFLDYEVSSPSKSSSFDSEKIWTTSRDKLLMQLALSHRKDWKTIAQKFNDPRITPKIAKTRFEDVCETNKLKNSSFTHEEDLTLAYAINQFGCKWCYITEVYFPHKTPTLVKNRYHNHIKRKNLLDQYVIEYQNSGIGNSEKEILD
mmetsp:Transcript_27351/g.24120  ORF Transcript_27351/g.24120 Transcript_27351/m.24120 type:complete len:184 (-) Transcript_27351:339-890(-)